MYIFAVQTLKNRNMEAKELRIGNYVNFAEENVLFQVVEIDSEGLTVENKTDKTWIELETFEGVKINEEWLLKLGFVENDFSCVFENGSTWIHKEDNIFWFDTNKDFIEMEYVHQLQNLYFALNKQELEVNETSK